MDTAKTGSDGYYVFDLQPGEGFYAVVPEDDTCIFNPGQAGVTIPQETEFGAYNFRATD